MSKRLNPWQHNYKAGQNVICTVSKPEPGGYAVFIKKDNLPGFLPTQAILQIGEDVLAQFVCVNNNRILLSARISNASASIMSGAGKPSTNWADQLNDENNYPSEPPGTAGGADPNVPGATQVNQRNSGQYAPHPGENSGQPGHDTQRGMPQYFAGQTGQNPPYVQPPQQNSAPGQLAGQPPGPPHNAWQSTSSQNFPMQPNQAQGNPSQGNPVPGHPSQKKNPTQDNPALANLSPEDQAQFYSEDDLAFFRRNNPQADGPPGKPNADAASPAGANQNGNPHGQPGYADSGPVVSSPAQQYQAPGQPLPSGQQAPANYGNQPGGIANPQAPGNYGNQQAQQQQSNQQPPQSYGSPPTAPQGQAGGPGQYGQQIQFPQPSSQIAPPQSSDEADRAFAAWAPEQTPTRRYRLKRATDLILPPIPPEEASEFKIADYDLEWLITDLEGGMRTGCVKAACEERLSRSAMLLYKGRAVGCIYSNKAMPNPQPTEQSLHYMLNDLQVPSTDVKLYDLPEDVTLAMSALFMGYPVQRKDDLDARAYMDYICEWFASKEQTACLALSLNDAGTCLVFIYRGKFCGAFYVEDYLFVTDIEFVHNLMRKDPKANIDASILPPDMTSSAVRFGYSLSMSRQRPNQEP